MLARCVPPDQFFPTIDLLFERQKLWAGAEADTRKELFSVMTNFGMDQDTFDACIQKKQLAEAIYLVAKTANAEFDVKSTPTFFLNGRLIRGTQDFVTFGSMIDAELARKDG